MMDTNPAENEMSTFSLLPFLPGVVTLAAGLSLYVNALRNRNYWMTMEFVIGACCVVAYPFARSVMPYYLEATEDSFSVYLFQMVCSGLAARAAAIFFTRTSCDQAVSLSVCVTSILERGAILLAMFCCFTRPETLSESFSFQLKMNFIFYTLLLAGDVLHLSKATLGVEGRMRVGGHIAKHLLFDGVIGFIFGTFLFGFSELFIVLMNPEFNISVMNLMLTKMAGSLFIGGSLVSFAALCFRNVEDSIGVLQSRLAHYIPILMISITNHQDDQYRGAGHVVLIMGVVGILALNSEIAIWRRRGKTD